jgi:hypothetical protein
MYWLIFFQFALPGMKDQRERQRRELVSPSLQPLAGNYVEARKVDPPGVCIEV